MRCHVCDSPVEVRSFGEKTEEDDPEIICEFRCTTCELWEAVYYINQNRATSHAGVFMPEMLDMEMYEEKTPDENAYYPASVRECRFLVENYWAEFQSLCVPAFAHVKLVRKRENGGFSPVPIDRAARLALIDWLRDHDCPVNADLGQLHYDWVFPKQEGG